MKRLLIIFGFLIVSLATFSQTNWTSYYTLMLKDSAGLDSAMFVMQTDANQGVILFTSLDSALFTNPEIFTSLVFGSASISEAELEILDGATWTTAEGNDILAGNTLEDVIADDATDIASSKAVVAYAVAQSSVVNGSPYIWLTSDSIVFGSSGLIDSCNTTWAYLITPNKHGSDTLTITHATQMCRGTNVDVTLDIIKNDSLNPASSVQNDTIISAMMSPYILKEKFTEDGAKTIGMLTGALIAIVSMYLGGKKS